METRSKGHMNRSRSWYEVPATSPRAAGDPIVRCLSCGLWDCCDAAGISQTCLCLPGPKDTDDLNAACCESQFPGELPRKGTTPPVTCSTFGLSPCRFHMGIRLISQHGHWTPAGLCQRCFSSSLVPLAWHAEQNTEQSCMPAPPPGNSSCHISAAIRSANINATPSVCCFV